jgi:hypothetical protein
VGLERFADKIAKGGDRPTLKAEPTFFFLPVSKNLRKQQTINDKTHHCAMGMKRGRESRNLAKKAAKKQRLEENADQNGDGIVGLDDLDWQTVQLPDRLGDVGGFFGLEEIDGVDVIRPESSGQIKFKVLCNLKIDWRLFC